MSLKIGLIHLSQWYKSMNLITQQRSTITTCTRPYWFNIWPQMSSQSLFKQTLPSLSSIQGFRSSVVANFFAPRTDRSVVLSSHLVKSKKFQFWACSFNCDHVYLLMSLTRFTRHAREWDRFTIVSNIVSFIFQILCRLYRRLVRGS